MTTLTLAKLAEIEAAAAKATPGPWSVEDGHYPSFKELRGPSFKVSVVMFATDLTEADYQARNADLRHIAICDPQTVAALCRIARAAANYAIDTTGGDSEDRFMAMYDAPPRRRADRMTPSRLALLLAALLLAEMVVIAVGVMRCG